MDDRYLEDYHLAFRGTTPDWQVPDSMWREYQAIERKEKQAGKSSIVVSGSVFTLFLDESGNVNFQSKGKNAFTLTPAEFK